MLKGHKPLNPNNESLTVDTLKTFSGFEGLSIEDAEQKIVEIKLLSAILIDLLKTQENENNVEQINTAA